jgi:DnaK suppressor protein
MAQSRRRREPAAAAGTEVDTLRERLRREYDAAVRRLRDLGISPQLNDAEPHEGDSALVDEGDVAQANQRQDMSFTTRQRLADRINRLAAALERIDEGTYGTCSVCAGPIEGGRLAAIPEASRCLRCQADLERSRNPQVA